MAKFTLHNLKYISNTSSLYMPYFKFTFSKGTKIEVDSMVMILDDPRASDSFNIYKTVENTHKVSFQKLSKPYTNKLIT
ncbi:hypothetical protein F383_34988 [Gossypium arboreum]|uniref:Uncharacterized protein n=1 Tax=Gossypium arboreum TaxID=29729 RepID=A0A0B0N0E7_GOSAR|nr:hypothetical protein F383_34988 [Gossypium arboreum]